MNTTEWNSTLNTTFQGINSTNNSCSELFDSITEVLNPEWFKSILVTTGVSGILLNFMVIQTIKACGLVQNQSVRLLMYFSMVDIISSLNNIIRFVFSKNEHLVSCQAAQFLHVMGLFSIHSSIYMFAVTALDRYFKVCYMEEYERKFTPIRFKISLAWYLLLITLQTFMAGYFNLKYYIGYGSKYTISINITVVVLTDFLYARSIILLRRYKKVNEAVAENIQNIILTTEICLYLFGLNQVYMLAASIIFRMQILTPSQKIVGRQLATLLPCLTGLINAIYFFAMNKAAKEDIKLRLRYWRQEYFFWIPNTRVSMEPSNEQIQK